MSAETSSGKADGMDEFPNVLQLDDILDTGIISNGVLLGLLAVANDLKMILRLVKRVLGNAHQAIRKPQKSGEFNYLAMMGMGHLKEGREFLRKNIFCNGPERFIDFLAKNDTNMNDAVQVVRGFTTGAPRLDELNRLRDKTLFHYIPGEFKHALKFVDDKGKFHLRESRLFLGGKSFDIFYESVGMARAIIAIRPAGDKSSTSRKKDYYKLSDETFYSESDVLHEEVERISDALDAFIAYLVQGIWYFKKGMIKKNARGEFYFDPEG